MTPLELGDGISDTNTVPGVKHRSFFAVLSSGARVVIDSVSRTIIIDKTGKAGAMSAVVTDNDSVLTLTGGATGGVARSVTIDTSAAHAVGFGVDGDKGRPLSIVAIRDCEPSDGAAVYNRLIIASARFRVA